MIELRWLSKAVVEIDCSDDVKLYDISPMLQYRQTSQVSNHRSVWSDWEDVPTVEEDMMDD